MNRTLVALIAAFSLAAISAQAQTSTVGSAVPTTAQAPETPKPDAARTVHFAIPAGKESWTDLSLAKSGLNPEAFNAVLLSKVDKPEYTSELVRLEWRQGDGIELTIVRPQHVAKPSVILYLYDQTSDTDRFRNEAWCKMATQGGYAAVGFVSALAGQRFHAPRPMKTWFVSELQESLSTSTHDVQMILNYLGTLDDLNAKQVGMFGQGSGGSIAILAASVDPRIVALDLLNPWGDWPDWLKESKQIPDNERADYLKPEFLAKVSSLDPMVYLPHLNLKALRIQQVMVDPVTPQAAKDKIAAAAPKQDNVVRYKDVVASVKAFRADGLSGWLRSHLGPDAQPAGSPTIVATKQK